MKALKAPPHVPRHSLLHPEREYINSVDTDLRATFARIRAEQAKQTNVRPIPKRKQA